MTADIYRLRANAQLVRGGPPHSILGPVACHTCGTAVYYSYSQTRASFPAGPTIRSWLCWREKGGRVHKCPAPQRKRRVDRRGSRWAVGR